MEVRLSYRYYEVCLAQRLSAEGLVDWELDIMGTYLV